MHTTRQLRLMAAGVALALLTGCTTSAADGGSSSNTSAPAAGSGGAPVTAPATYRLGVALPATGSAAGYGAEYVQVINMAIEDANKQYAADGITLETVSADTQATAEGGASAANKLGAVDKAPVVLTAWSAVVSAMQPVATDLGFAILNPGAQSPTLVGKPNVVNTIPMNDAQLAGYTKYLVDTLGYKKFATVYVDNESGQGTADAFKSAIEALGGTMVAEESIRQDATDASTQVAKVEAAAPDFIYVQTLLVEGAAVFKAFHDSGTAIPIGTYNAEAEARLIRDAGQETFNGVIYTSHLPKDVAGVTDLLDKLKTRMNGTTLVNQSYDAYFYGAVFLYAEVIKRLRAQGQEVTGANFLSLLGTAKDITVPIIGAMDLTDQLTYRTTAGIRKVVDFSQDPLVGDETVDTSATG